MEKISIARRRWEKRQPLFSIKTDSSSPGMEACMHMPTLPGMESPAPETKYHSLQSLLCGKASFLQINKRQFMVEIVSGFNRPLKLLISLELIDADRSDQGFLPQSDQGFLTVEEAARICQVSKDTIYHQLHQGILQGLKIRRKWRIFSSSLSKTAED